MLTFVVIKYDKYWQISLVTNNSFVIYLVSILNFLHLSSMQNFQKFPA